MLRHRVAGSWSSRKPHYHDISILMLSSSHAVHDPLSGFPTEFGNYFSSLRRIIQVYTLHKDRGTSLYLVTVALILLKYTVWRRLSRYIDCPGTEPRFGDGGRDFSYPSGSAPRATRVSFHEMGTAFLAH
jgi:hypothetical protein